MIFSSPLYGKVFRGVRIWWREGHPLVSRWTHTADSMGLTWVGHAANHYHWITRWVRWSWWSYVLQKPDKYNRTCWRTVVWCRLKGHPNGWIYFNAGGMEPDDRCKDCLEHIW